MCNTSSRLGKEHGNYYLACRVEGLGFGLYSENGKENGNYRDFRDYIGLYSGYRGV